VASTQDDLPPGKVVLDVNYETGTLNSGIRGLDATLARAPDAARIVDGAARSGRYAISHKVTLHDPAYVSAGAPRSESDTNHWEIGQGATRHRPGMHAIYTVSLMLKDWQRWRGGAHPTDILWQFKHTHGSPDGFVGVNRNSVIFRYGASAQRHLADESQITNKWLDMKFDIYWSDKNDGWIKLWTRFQGQKDYKLAVNVSGIRTFTGNPAKDFGYLKWGMYRPKPKNRALDASVPLTREVYHDDIKMIVLPK
jgi:hypothetical protein